MSSLLLLILAHLLGDFVLQPEKWVKDKADRKGRSVYLYLHILIHTALLFFLLNFDLNYWPVFAIIAGTHYLIDLMKVSLSGKWNHKLLFFVDQVLHFIVLFAVAHYYFSINFSTAFLFQDTTILFIVELICVTRVSSVIMMFLLDSWKFEDAGADDSLKNAGKYIGMLERLFVFGFIVLNQWPAIGWPMAAKSVFRFNDLSRAKDRKLTEYFLIGTLVSFGLAIGFALLYQYFLQVISSTIN